MSKIAITSVGQDVYAAVTEAIESLGETVVAPGDRVLIKPNLVHSRAFGVNDMTSPAVIEAVARYCLECGAYRIVIGEGPGCYNNRSELKQCFIHQRVPEIAKKLGIEWVLFDDHKFRTFRNVSDCTPDIFHVTEYAFDCDKLIDLPVLKTHYMTTVTLAMKNLKGCLKYEDKSKFHSPDLERAVVELNKIVRPTFNIIDATWQPGNNKVLVAGMDIVAIDAVGCALMDIDPAEVRTVTLGAAAGIGEGELTRIEIIGADLKRLKMKVPLPRQQLERAFPLLEITGTERACSGCIFPLVSALLNISDQSIKLTYPLRICLGKKPVVPTGKACIVVGDCAEVQSATASWIGGCPPDREELLARIRQVMSTP